MDEMKWCSWCNQDKPIARFIKRKRKLKDGTVKEYPMTWCKDCERERVKRWRKKNPDKAKAMWARQRKKLAPEETRRYKREWWRMNHGKGVKVWKKYAHELDEDIIVPAGPFRRWLLWVEEELHFLTEAESMKLRRKQHDRWTWRKLAEAVDSDYKVFWRIRRGESQTVSLTLVDKVGHLLGYPSLVMDLYPLGEEEPEKSKVS